MTRHLDWEQRLGDYLDSVRDKPFCWGRHDCALHSANAVLAMTGEDFAAEFRGKYRSVAGSVRALRLYGAGDLASTMTAKFGESISPAFAQRGDVVMSSTGDLGICMGPSAFFVGQEGERPGLLLVPRREWAQAWRVA